MPIGDFDPNVLDSVIKARNQVVHMGIGNGEHADIGPYMFVARALVTPRTRSAAGSEGRSGRKSSSACFGYL